MKKLLVLLFIGISYLNSQNDYATIHLYREKMFKGSAAGFPILMNGLEICKLRNGGHLEYKVFNITPLKISTYLQALNAQNKEIYITLNPKKGKHYHIKMEYKVFGNSIEFEQLSEPLPEDEQKEKNYISLNDIGFKENANIFNHPKTNWTISSLKEHWKSKKISQLEGVYEQIGSKIKYTLAVIKEKTDYKLIYIDGLNGTHWKEGDVKAFLEKTATYGLYKSKYYNIEKEEIDDVFITFTNSGMSFVSEDGTKDMKFLKVYPTYDDKEVTASNNPEGWTSSGTGFLINSNGYIATNNHVIEESQNIEVDFNGKKYSAKVVKTDILNDLAILKVENFPNTEILYNFQTDTKDVGTKVFAIGFPNIQIQGVEPKTTDGIINSKKGFKDEKNCYQISAPLQPGNSGGPLFDLYGNLVGINVAGIRSEDNVGYSVKTWYLKSLLDEIEDVKITTPNYILPEQKEISELNKTLVNYVCLIKVK